LLCNYGKDKQPKNDQPLSFDKVPNFTDFGVGCHLISGAEV